LLIRIGTMYHNLPRASIGQRSVEATAHDFAPAAAFIRGMAPRAQSGVTLLPQSASIDQCDLRHPCDAARRERGVFASSDNMSKSDRQLDACRFAAGSTRKDCIYD
jgi:hypothetical protein